MTFANFVKPSSLHMTFRRHVFVVNHVFTHPTGAILPKTIDFDMTFQSDHFFGRHEFVDQTSYHEHICFQNICDQAAFRDTFVGLVSNHFPKPSVLPLDLASFTRATKPVQFHRPQSHHEEANHEAGDEHFQVDRGVFFSRRRSKI